MSNDDDRGDRAEDLVGPGRQVGRHVGEDGRPVEQALVRAAVDEPRAAVDRPPDDAVDAGELLLVDDRPEVDVLAVRVARAAGAAPSRRARRRSRRRRCGGRCGGRPRSRPGPGTGTTA